MLVYGDPSEETGAGALLDALRAHLHEAAEKGSLDALRAILIHSGQAEQALADAADRGRGMGPAARLVEELSDLIAGRFVAALGMGDHAPRPHSDPEARAREACAALPGNPPRLRVKVPEGFAFYALYPEQYARAALDWSRRTRPDRPVLVLGIRSIGTTLSSVVAAALRSGGIGARRMTIRPTGHPFAREARIAVSSIGGVGHALVVDEGPGLSGSSMAAAARALARAGFPLERIVFLPGHSAEPGASCTPENRALWHAMERTVCGTDQPIFGGASLSDTLSQLSRRWRGGPPAISVADLSGGRWRSRTGMNPSGWPPSAGLLERPKYLCTAPDGRAVIWKFAGLAIGADGRSGATRELEALHRLAQLGWSPPPLRSALGFVALPWVDGPRPSVATPAILRALAMYIADVTGPALAPELARDGIDRLAQMLVCNTREALGDAHAAAASRLHAFARELLPTTAIPVYGDGRMAPHEWVISGGRLQKLDAGGHDADHTIVGAQPWWWDLAGATIEWDLCQRGRGTLLAELARRGLTPPSPALERFFIAAYCAFRLGVCTLAESWGADKAERARLHAARARYTATLARTLAPRITPGRSPPSRSRSAPTARSRPGARRSPTRG
jgi:hypothetical protein